MRNAVRVSNLYVVPVDRVSNMAILYSRRRPFSPLRLTNASTDGAALVTIVAGHGNGANAGVPGIRRTGWNITRYTIAPAA